MKNIKYFLGNTSLFLTAFMLSFQSGALADPTMIAGIKNSEAIVEKHRETGKVSFIGSNSPDGIKLPSTFFSLASNPQEKSRNFIRAYAPLFGIEQPDTDLVAKKSFTLESQSTLKYQQVHKSIPVLGAEINVNLNKAGSMLSMSGEAAPNLTLSTTAKISTAQALNTALKVVQKQYNLGASNVNATTPQLQIYQPGIIDPGDGPAKLVWFIKVTAKTVQPVEQIVLVDAVELDRVVLSWNNNPHTRTRQTYTANHTTTMPGTLLCGESNPTCAGGSSDALRAHVYAGDTYNFYLRNHGRDSINGSGMPIISTVQYRVNYVNAFWDGRQMVYGDRLSQADDVVAHELTHGVTQYTSNLFYYYQSRAINESLSDIWGGKVIYL